MDKQFHELLQGCLNLGWGERVDRPLFRSLEIRWASGVLNGCRPDADDLIAMAPACTLPSLVARREDAYALTHTLFYATDFGAYPLPDCVSTQRVTASLDALLAWQLWEDDLDLVGELLAAAYACALPSRYSDMALTAVWSELNRPVVRGPFAAHIRHRMNSIYDVEVFGSCYHTTLVAGILCATYLAAPPVNSPQNQTPGPDRALVTEEALESLRLVNQPERLSASWVTGIDGVLEPTQTVIACVLDGALASAYRADDLRTVAVLHQRLKRYGVTTATSLAAAVALDFRTRHG
ncbi:hypothetical protein OG757_44545 [Streptomyces sp. NBC_01262]|nr:hypothetical protein [Streptomyces sp. NBC_01262]